ncbi:FKBP-type peptidyl-prolyl cis-trans isomerase [Psychrosphaera ytuae]|uniref:Peptidyl-prolyl cis-trans isomerase n=1 Tax=Psychrosphaera ytuae TaxID=2820710 RepID=A0A975DE34_9GAMM|nr:FKBP-type peptidyl-prolyl cis-trans isomerase [Psychrosphaera ytuae]QTH65284.1 FKBP-type peptidyl-prolyl cis-trans isomerase [Psychrosphaera ytuae]
MGSEVVFHFTIKLSDDSVADSTKVSNKPAKLVIGDGSLTKGFEDCLIGLEAGQEAAFTLPPEQAFGQPNPDNIYYVDRTKFTDVTPEVGAIIAFTQPDGSDLPGLVREVAGQSVTIDFNHPLAGQTLTFEVEIIEVKSLATEVE